jgi:hypothetical protein
MYGKKRKGMIHMWERREKNCYGEVKGVYRPWASLPEKPVYDAVPNVKYMVEYLRSDMVDAEERSHLRGSEIEPYELYDEYETDSLGLALREIIYRMFDEDTADFRLFVDFGDKDICADIPGDIYRIAREAVQSGINKKIDALEEDVENLNVELAAYKGFLDSIPGGAKMFREWREEVERR